MKKSLVLFAFVATFLIPAYGQYAFTTLQFPGASITRTLGLNDRGQVVGGYVDVGQPQHAMLFSRGDYIPLDPSGLLGTRRSLARGINNAGQVVGIIAYEGVQRGFVLSGDSLTLLDYPGAAATSALGINDCGTIVGDFTDGDGFSHAFSYTAGKYTEIDVPGAVDTHALGVNCHGDIVGYWDLDPNVDIGHGFLLTRDGVLTSFEVPFAPPESSQADSINDVGQIVGVYLDNLGTAHGFLLAGSTFTRIDVPGADTTVIWRISNAGQIVGVYTQAGVRSGFIGTPIPSQKR